MNKIRMCATRFTNARQNNKLKMQAKERLLIKQKHSREILTNVDNRRRMPRLQINTFLLTKWANEMKQCWC